MRRLVSQLSQTTLRSALRFRGLQLSGLATEMQRELVENAKRGMYSIALTHTVDADVFSTF